MDVVPSYCRVPDKLTGFAVTCALLICLAVELAAKPYTSPCLLWLADDMLYAESAVTTLFSPAPFASYV